MPISSRYLIFLCAAAAAAQDAPKPQFTARELFYSAASEPAAGAKPAAVAPTAAAKKPATSTATATPPATPKKPATPPPTVVATSTPKVAPTPTPSTPQSGALPGGASVIRASAIQTAPAPTNGTPLGLKYTILKKSGDDMVEVPSDTVFHADDKIQVSVQTNGPGYLYVVHQGSSGTWAPIFPSPEVAEGNNHVDGWSALAVPPGSLMRFDTLAGTEKLFVVFSRIPEQGLEKLIYSLQGNKIKPAATQQDRAQPKQMVNVASVDIDNSTVGQLRETYTRDLIIEKINDKTPADKSPSGKKDNATYVVNPTGSSEARVVADIFMVHQ